MIDKLKRDTGQHTRAVQVALVLVAIGLVISGYMSYTKLLDVPIVCVEGETFSCSTVENTRWAELFGIPVAYLGFSGYLLIGLILYFENHNHFLQEYGRLLLFGIGLVGWLFSMWLVYVQAVVILAFCQWCLAHELNFTILFGVVIYLLWQHWQDI
ncbi:MAG: vitamin K epoxide reductase family protein [Anaerolineae bacterium]